jgi:uncharacterized protein (TIGR02118 family)
LTEGEPVIKVSILYPNKPGGRFDAEYYVNVHMPLAMRLLVSAVKSVSVEVGVSGATGGQEPPFHAVTGFTCESMKAFSEAFLPAADELRADIPNFTDIEPIIQVSKVSELIVHEPAHAG